MEKSPALNRSRWIFLLGLASLPYLFYGSMLAIFGVLVNLIRIFKRPCLDPLTTGCVTFIAGLLLLSSIVAYDRGEAFLQLANFLPYLLLFSFLPALLRSVQTLERLAIALLIAAIPINLIAIVEYGLKSPVLPTSWQNWSWIEALRAAPHKGRAMVMFDHPNTLASYLVIVLGLGLGLAIAHRRSPASSPPPPSPPPSSTSSSLTPPPSLSSAPFKTVPYLSVFLLPATFLNLLGLFCTGSRNGLAIALSQVVVYVWIARPGRKVIGAIALILMALATGTLALGLGVRPLAIANVTDDPRLGIWKIALDLIQARPWLGWGLGNYKFLYPPRLIDPTYQEVFHPHNIWLLLGAEAGILVMVALTVMVAFICFRAVRDGVLNGFRKGKAIALGYLLAFWGCVGFGLLDVTFYDVRVNALNWTILAALYGIPYLDESDDV